jgi:hypothetical protein
MLFGGASALMSHDGGSAMLAGFFGCGALMGAIAALRRPTDAERQAKEVARARRAAASPLHKREFWKKAAGVVAFGVAAVLAREVTRHANMPVWTDTAPLTGKARTGFIDNGTKTCFEKQRRDQLNAGLSNGAIQDYCQCYMNNLADSISNKELSELQTDTIPESFKPRIEHAGNRCLSMDTAQAQAAPKGVNERHRRSSTAEWLDSLDSNAHVNGWNAGTSSER